MYFINLSTKTLKTHFKNEKKKKSESLFDEENMPLNFVA